MDHGPWHFDVFADFFQFLVADEGADWSDLADAWLRPNAVDFGFVQGDRYVAIGTARNFVVPVTVRVGSENEVLAPPADRVSHGVLDVSTGIVEVMSISDNGLTGGRLPLATGRYLLTAVARGLQSISTDGIDGDDSYEIVLRRVDVE